VPRICRADAVRVLTSPLGAETVNWDISRVMRRGDPGVQGRTNRAIAHALEVSPRTVAKHLEHIYRKLGVSSRAAAGYRAAAPPPGNEPGPARSCALTHL
jgi:hypothetical protein